MADSAPSTDSTTEAYDPAAKKKIYNRRVVFAYNDHNVVRTGPGEGYAIVGVHKKGASFIVLAKKDAWYNIQLSDTETGWVHASLCKEEDDLSDLEFKPNPRIYSRVGSFVLTGFGGAYAFDRKSNSFTAGGRIGYYLLDFVEVEGTVGWTHITRPREIIESLFDLSLESEDFHMLYYGMNVLVEVLPGRQMVPFVTGGVGSTILQGQTESSVNYGAGTRLFVSRRTAMRWEVRSHHFESGVDEARRKNSNIEFSFGTSFLF